MSQGSHETRSTGTLRELGRNAESQTLLNTRQPLCFIPLPGDSGAYHGVMLQCSSGIRDGNLRALQSLGTAFLGSSAWKGLLQRRQSVPPALAGHPPGQSGGLLCICWEELCTSMHTHTKTRICLCTHANTHHTHVCTQGHKYIMYTVHPIYRDTQTHAYVMYKHTDTPKHAHTDIHNIQIQIKIHTIIHIFSIKINFSIFKPSTVYNEHKAYDVWLPSVKLSSRNREKRINCSLI